MKARKVIDPTHFALRPPVVLTTVVWLVLDKLQARGWIWGVAGTVLAVCWVVAIIDICTRESVRLKELE